MDKLISVQDKDRRILQLSRELSDIPRRREAIANRLAQQQAAVEKAKTDIMQCQAEIKDIELRTESNKTRLAKYRVQQNEVRDNEQYRAMEREIRGTEDDIRKLEDEELVFMEKLEVLKEVLAAADADLIDGEGDVLREQEQMDGRMGGLEEELNDLKSERAALAAEVDDEFLTRYDRIFKHTGDFALVGTNGGFCGGCNMKIPPQLVHNSRKADQITVCSYCGRMLYSGV